MKVTATISLLIGLSLGSVGTHLARRGLESNPKWVQSGVADENPAPGEQDETEPEKAPEPVTDEDGYGLILKDPDSVQQRHMCIAAWYGSQDFVSSSFGTHTGHKFRPVWNRRNPIMILEEHLEFMRKFMAETDRLELEQEQNPIIRDAIESRLRRESATDPQDGALIDWQDCFDEPEDGNPPLWYGVSMKTKRWLAFKDGKGVYEPDDALLERILEKEKQDDAEDSEDPFSN